MKRLPEASNAIASGQIAIVSAALEEMLLLDSYASGARTCREGIASGSDPAGDVVFVVEPSLNGHGAGQVDTA